MFPGEQGLTSGELPGDLIEENRAEWYAVQVKARCEKQVAQVLENKGYEIFLPPRSRLQIVETEGHGGEIEMKLTT